MDSPCPQHEPVKDERSVNDHTSWQNSEHPYEGFILLTLSTILLHEVLIYAIVD